MTKATPHGLQQSTNGIIRVALIATAAIHKTGHSKSSLSYTLWIKRLFEPTDAKQHHEQRLCKHEARIKR